MRSIEKKNSIQDVYIFPDYLTHSEDEVWSTYLQEKSRLFLFELPGHKKIEKGESPQDFSKFIQTLEKKILEDQNQITIISTGHTCPLALELSYKYPKKINLCILISPVLTESKWKLLFFRLLNIFHWLKKEKISFFQFKSVFTTRNIYLNLIKKIPLLKNLSIDTETVFLFSGKKSYLNDFATRDTLSISKNAEVIRFRNSERFINRSDWRFKRLIFEILNDRSGIRNP